ncbi:hypothetical protein NtRootA1_42670 [Arthrobacter sp. NtRootA1]|nr:hypothetical protein NtRootA1_42670 [Arthrobacter sp. NtRootA1]
MRDSGPTWGAEQAPQHIPRLRLRTDRPETAHVAGPDVRASGPTWGEMQAPQHIPTHVAGPDMRDSRPTWGAEQAPQDTHRLRLRTDRTETPLVAGPEMRASSQKWSAEQAPQRPPSSQRTPSPQHTPTHTPAPALKGAWPELATRPAPTANPATAPVTEAIARQARLTDEHRAV